MLRSRKNFKHLVYLCKYSTKPSKQPIPPKIAKSILEEDRRQNEDKIYTNATKLFDRKWQQSEKIVDFTRKQPIYEWPYSGPKYYIDDSGFHEDYIFWWEDPIQLEWAMDEIEYSGREIWWNFLTVLGWASALWWFYRYFLQQPMQEHPFARVPLSAFPLEQRMRAKDRIKQRREEMQKYGIIEKDGEVYREDLASKLK